MGEQLQRRRGLARFAKPKTHHATERPRYSVDRVLNPGVGPRDFIFHPEPHSRRKLARKRLLVREVVVEGTLGHICAGRDLVDAEGVEVARSQQRMCRVKQCLARFQLPAISATEGGALSARHRSFQGWYWGHCVKT